MKCSSTPPTRDRVEDFFDNTLPSLPGGILYLHWGGHGVMRDGVERHLFYANIRKGAALTFNLEHRLAQLRKRDQFSDQHIFIDACANYVELTQFPGLAPTQLVNAGRVQFVTQHVLCAAASGEKAKNDPVRRTGLFSGVLLEEFDKDPGWPSAEALAPRLEQVFLERARTDANYRHRPVWLRFRAENGGGYDLGGVPKSPALQRLSQLSGCAIAQLDRLAQSFQTTLLATDPVLRDQLYQLVAGRQDRPFRADAVDDCAAIAAWTLTNKKIAAVRDAMIAAGLEDAGYVEEELLRAQLTVDANRLLDDSHVPFATYERLLKKLDPNAKPMLLLDDLLHHLANQGPLKRSKLHRFLLEAGELAANQPQKAALEALVQSYAGAQYVADLRQQIHAAWRYRVLLSVKETPSREMTVWGVRLRNGIPDGDRVASAVAAPAELLPSLESLYDRLISDLDEVQVDSVEIILALPQLQLELESTGIPVESPLPKTPLCQRLPVALRWRNRILQPTKYGKREWLEAAKHIATLGPNISCHRLPSVRDEAYWKKLKTPPAHLLDLDFVPTGAGGDHLAMALYRGGVPYACWQRTAPAAGYAQAVDTFAQQLADFASLPQTLPHARASQAEIATLALFWDDPETDPADLIKHYEEIR